MPVVQCWGRPRAANISQVAERSFVSSTRSGRFTHCQEEPRSSSGGKRKASEQNGSLNEDNHSNKMRMRSELTCVRDGCKRSSGQAVCRVCRLLLRSGCNVRSRELDSDFAAWAIPERMERLSGI